MQREHSQEIQELTHQMELRLKMTREEGTLKQQNEIKNLK
jgi:hypothetical protein